MVKPVPFNVAETTSHWVILKYFMKPQDKPESIVPDANESAINKKQSIYDWYDLDDTTRMYFFLL
jgi:hypothetical protein